jgi:hypothetical protein
MMALAALLLVLVVADPAWAVPPQIAFMDLVSDPATGNSDTSVPRGSRLCQRRHRAGSRPAVTENGCYVRYAQGGAPRLGAHSLPLPRGRPVRRVAGDEASRRARGAHGKGRIPPSRLVCSSPGGAWRSGCASPASIVPGHRGSGPREALRIPQSRPAGPGGGAGWRDPGGLAGYGRRVGGGSG